MALQSIGENVTVRGETFRITDVRNVSHLGSKFFGKMTFDLVKVSDGTWWGYCGKRVTVNARLSERAKPAEVVRAEKCRTLRDGIDAQTAMCARCGVNMYGNAEIIDGADGEPVAVCVSCPTGVNFRTAYPVGTEVRVTSGFAEHLTATVEAVCDAYPGGEYAYRNYRLTLPGYGSRSMAEDILTPVDGDAERYAVRRDAEAVAELTEAEAEAEPVADAQVTPDAEPEAEAEMCAEVARRLSAAYGVARTSLAARVAVAYDAVTDVVTVSGVKGDADTVSAGFGRPFRFDADYTTDDGGYRARYVPVAAVAEPVAEVAEPDADTVGREIMERALAAAVAEDWAAVAEAVAEGERRAPAYREAGESGTAYGWAEVRAGIPVAAEPVAEVAADPVPDVDAEPTPGPVADRPAVPDAIRPGVWVVTGGGYLGTVQRAGRQGRAEGWQILDGGAYSRFAEARSLRLAVIGDSVCRSPRFACFCGKVHAPAEVFRLLPALPEPEPTAEPEPEVAQLTTDGKADAFPVDAPSVADRAPTPVVAEPEPTQGQLFACADTRAAARRNFGDLGMIDGLGNIAADVLPDAVTAEPVAEPEPVAEVAEVPEVTVRAVWSADAGEVTVIRDRRAGVCGPAGTYPADSRDLAAEALTGAGYTVGAWRADGDGWVCDLAEVEAEPFTFEPEPFNAADASAEPEPEPVDPWAGLDTVDSDALAAAINHMTAIDPTDGDTLYALGDACDRAQTREAAEAADAAQADAEAAAARTPRRPSRAQTLRREYAEMVGVWFEQAETDCRGHMLTPAGEAAGIDPRSLWSGPSARVEKYASEELREWFATHGRVTAGQWREQHTETRPVPATAAEVVAGWAAADADGVPVPVSAPVSAGGAGPERVALVIVGNVARVGYAPGTAVRSTLKAVRPEVLRRTREAGFKSARCSIVPQREAREVTVTLDGADGAEAVAVWRIVAEVMAAHGFNAVADAVPVG
ncbi:hypothetical protein ABZY58_11550 [Micromonospora tulbaghiae]|uniref:hypothetical protein n=1 Tax=Micromonospora tulbaghiae TaxID=479978 RepID=UPI0033A49022